MVILYSCLTMDLSYSNKEKLKSKKLIEKLFMEGKAISAFPLRLIYLKDGVSNKAGMSVSKRNFKNAVDRNRVKRLLREAYIHNKKMLIDNNEDGYALMILYISKDLPDYDLVNSKTKVLFSKFLDKISDS